MQRTMFIRAIWDDEAKVWVATSDDVPGLATEAESAEALVTKLQVIIPELLDANGVDGGADVPFEVLYQRHAIARRQAA